MPTEKQKSLFTLLEIPHDREPDIRQYHKLNKQIGAPHSFTIWLEKCLQAKWRKENKRTYLGE